MKKLEHLKVRAWCVDLNMSYQQSQAPDTVTGGVGVDLRG